MIALLAITAYFIGSFPFAWGMTKLSTGKDLREMGSGNAGVMNVMIHVSRWAGVLLFLAEALKGIVAVILANAFGGSEVEISVSVLAVVVGTRWPVWLGFRGGRGNTAGLGALSVLSWPTLLVSLIIWGMLRWLTRNSFWATRTMLVVVPIILGMITRSSVLGLMTMLLCLIYISTQEKATDDHLLIKQRWSSFWAFLTTAPRQKRDKRVG